MVGHFGTVSETSSNENNQEGLKYTHSRGVKLSGSTYLQFVHLELDRVQFHLVLFDAPFVQVALLI